VTAEACAEYCRAHAPRCTRRHAQDDTRHIRTRANPGRGGFLVRAKKGKVKAARPFTIRAKTGITAMYFYPGKDRLVSGSGASKLLCSMADRFIFQQKT
jgi:hypothetical protein